MQKIELSTHGEKAKVYYEQGRWSREMLREVTRKGWITEAERKAITEEKE